MAAGVPILLGFAVGAVKPRVPHRRLLTTALATGIVLAHAATFLATLHRYVVGEHHPWMLGPFSWRPAGGLRVDLGLFALASIAYWWAIIHDASGEAQARTAPSTHAPTQTAR